MNLDNLKILNPRPRESIVYIEDDNFIIKAPVYHDRFGEWFKKQVDAKNIIDKLHKIKSPHYNIPHISLIKYRGKLDYVMRESRIHGEHLTPEFIETLSAEDTEAISHGLAHFCNDMNQLYPVKWEKDWDTASELMRERFDRIVKLLSKHFPEKDLDIILDARNFIKSPDGADAQQCYVFSHTDFNSGNLLYNRDTKTLSIIDFAESKYENINDMFEKIGSYFGGTPNIMEIYKSLPRAQPVGNFHTDINALHLRKHLLRFYNHAWAWSISDRHEKQRIEEIRHHMETIIKLFGLIKAKQNTENLKNKNQIDINNINKLYHSGRTP